MSRRFSGTRAGWRACLLLLVWFGAGLAAQALDPVVRIGNPLLARYPVSGDARPRSIWDMHVFDGKLYLAHGDYWNNRGPIPPPGDGKDGLDLAPASRESTAT